MNTNLNLRRSVSVIAAAGMSVLVLASPAPTAAADEAVEVTTTTVTVANPVTKTEDESSINDTWSVTQWCADSVNIVRAIPGKGRPMVWGKRLQAGTRVVVDERFAHDVGTSGATSCQEVGSKAYRSVGYYTQVNELVWGRAWGLHKTQRAPKGTRPGVYKYTAVAKAVACQLSEGTTISRCTGTPVVYATSTYTVKVAKTRHISWKADDDWGNQPLPQW